MLENSDVGHFYIWGQRGHKSILQGDSCPSQGTRLVSEETILEVNPAAPAIPTSSHLSHRAEKSQISDPQNLKAWWDSCLCIPCLRIVCSAAILTKQIGTFVWWVESQEEGLSNSQAQSTGPRAEMPRFAPRSAPQCFFGLMFLLNLFSFFYQMGVWLWLCEIMLMEALRWMGHSERQWLYM